MFQSRLLLTLLIVFSVGCERQKPTLEKDGKARLVKTPSPIKTSLRGISVVDSNTVWLTGAKGTILRTVNGGESWEVLPSPDEDSLDFRSIQAFGGEEAIVVSAGFPARIYKTTNAAQEWQLVYENLDSAAFMNSIAFKNSNEGIVIGDQLEGRHLILKTVDGGDSWYRIDSTNIPKPLPNENGFAASGSCIAINEIGEYFIALGGGHSRVFLSVDGESWTAVESQLETDQTSSGIYSISSGDGLMAVGGDYTQADSTHRAAISVDGKNWQLTKGFLNGYRSVVDYSKHCKCWLAAGTNGVEFSNDNGDSWLALSKQDVNTLRFAPKTAKVFLATKKGEIFTLSLE